MDCWAKAGELPSHQANGENDDVGFAVPFHFGKFIFEDLLRGTQGNIAVGQQNGPGRSHYSLRSRKIAGQIEGQKSSRLAVGRKKAPFVYPPGMMAE
ncbi:MAG: hypothetical protein H6559_34380 [Lewinellaceae bacterium]|nr:hypothetical protein [Lewinellaceae bacterium]